MIKTENDVIYNSLKNKVGFEKDAAYLRFIRETYHQTPHHLFGSFSQKLKTTDYTAIPVTEEEHREAELDKSNFAIKNLWKLIRTLIAYIQYLKAKKGIK